MLTTQKTDRKQVALVVGVFLMGMTLAIFLFTGVFGPTNNGLDCERSLERTSCRVFQTRFMGLIGDSSFSITESAIAGAKASCASSICTVYLKLINGQEYPVLSYSSQSKAETSAQKLNDYFRNRSVRSIEMNEDILKPYLLFGGVALLVAGIVLVMRWWRVPLAK